MPSATTPSEIIATALSQQATRIKLAANLKKFPDELFQLAEHLETLDLADNQLNQLPKDFGRFKKLRILFLSNNQFQHIPAVLADCPALEMIAFKNNGITEFGEDVLPIDTRWLILTGNQIKQLPESIGKLHRLQKLALGGNQIRKLPDSMRHCKNLELARLSANQLQTLPDWLLELPKLAWLAFAGNTMPRSVVSSTVPNTNMSDIQLKEKIGEGASGIIYAAHWRDQAQVAVKLFKGAITSDGYPQDELDCCLQVGEHPHLIQVLAQVDDEDQLGMVMELIPSTYCNLGLPPSLASCTRDTFSEGTVFNPSEILCISTQMCNTLAHLHQCSVSHGDVYAHNIMIDSQASVLFGDFGAASDLSRLPAKQQLAMQKVEVRAFGCLIEDLLSNCSEQQSPRVQALVTLKDQCMQAKHILRPSFTELLQRLESISELTTARPLDKL